MPSTRGPSPAALLLAMTLTVASCSGHSPDARGSWMTVPTPRPGEWLLRHREFVEIAHRGNVDVLFIGDSITEGWLDAGIASWKQHFAPLKAANFGIIADGTQHVLWRLLNGELEVIRPRVVVLLIGTNNIPWTFGGTTPEAVAAQVTEAVRLLVTTIRQALPESHILLLGILPRGEWENPSRAAIRATNRMLAGTERGRVRFLDIGELFLDGQHLPRPIMSDSLHPTARGYQLFARGILPAILELLVTTR